MKSLSEKSLISRELLTRTAFLGAICLFFSTLEYLFPRPVPFFRLGLANIPILLSLKILPFPYLMLLALLKVTGQGLINGTLASYVVLFSLSGTFLSLFAMYAIRKVKGLSFIGLSIIGALFSNAAQVTLSILIVFGFNARFIIPYFFTLALISGTAMGVFANWFSSRSRWYQALCHNRNFEPDVDEKPEEDQVPRKKQKDYIALFLPERWRFILGLFLLFPLFFQEVLLLKIIHVLALGILCKLAGKKISYLYFFNLIFWITLFQLLSPFGEVILDLKVLTLTRGALETGLNKAFLLIGLVFTSLFSVSPGLELPGRFGGVLAKMFYFYEELYNGKRKIKRASFIRDIDALLGETEKSLWTDRQHRKGKNNHLHRKKTVIFSAALLLFYYGLFAAAVIHSGLN